MRCLSGPTKCGRNGLSIWALAAATGLLFAVPSYAQGLVEYRFTGVVTDNTGNLGVFGPFNTVQVGNLFSGRFSYMTGPGNPDQEMGDPEFGLYDLLDFALDQSVVSMTPFGIGVTHEPGMPTLDPLPPDLGTDRLNIVGTFMTGQEIRPVTLRLTAPYQTVFTDDSLPETLTLGDFTDSQEVEAIRVVGLEPGFSQIDAGQLTSLVRVPEPTTSMMLMSLAAAVMFVRRRCIR